MTGKRSGGMALNANAKAANSLSSDKTVPTALLPLAIILPKCQTFQAALDCTLGSPRRPSGYFLDGREDLVIGVDPSHTKAKVSTEEDAMLKSRERFSFLFARNLDASLGFFGSDLLSRMMRSENLSSNRYPGSAISSDVEMLGNIASSRCFDASLRGALSLTFCLAVSCESDKG